MAHYAVNDRVKLRSGRVGTITRILLDSPMAMNCRYQVAMEPGRELIGINGLDVMERLTAMNNLPPHVQHASSGIMAFSKWPNMYKALREVDELLIIAGVKYVLQGSSAAILHGASVSVAPGDLDVCVGNLLAAKQALENAKYSKLPNSSHAVAKFLHPNQTEIDIVMAEEFGVNINRRTAVQGVWILTLVETLTSILLRPEIRQKEIEAFNSLILLKHESLTLNEREQVVKGVRIFSRGRIDTWDTVLTTAQDANKHFGMV
jgi:hypothetical protein